MLSEEEIVAVKDVERLHKMCLALRGIAAKEKEGRRMWRRKARELETRLAQVSDRESVTPWKRLISRNCCVRG
jgi:hypothetical protein